MQIFYSAHHHQHATDHLLRYGQRFPFEEVPARAERLLQGVQQAGLGPIQPPPDFGRAPLLAVHPGAYLDFLQQVHPAAVQAYGSPDPVFAATFSPRQSAYRPRGLLGQVGCYAYGVDSPIVAGTWEAAYWSAQCAVAAAQAVSSGAPVAYALCRPPGHHAGPDLFDGFCYLNNAAIAARHLQAQQAGARVALLDIDYHHGNGTQMIFYADPTVLFCSLHADPENEYPFFWGSRAETGVGPAVGFNHNWPLPRQTAVDAYLSTLTEALAVIQGFKPHYLVVSVGLDIALNDPLGGFTITTPGFTAIGQHIQALGLPTVLVQEGGYLLPQLGQNLAAFLQPFAAS